MNIFIFAGEMSGDLHGARLMSALTAKNPAIKFQGVAGPKMREVGLTRVLDMEQFQVMGFSDVLKSLPRLYFQFHRLKRAVLESNPEAVILIDYPGFNLRFARTLRKKGFKGKIIQYISPSVWAHGKGRIKTMSDNLDLLLTIYPFENQYFLHTSMMVEYIGNPLAANIQSHQDDPDWACRLGIPDSNHLIGVFPGSRRSEVKNNLSNQLRAAEAFKQQHPETVFAISVAHNDLYPLIRQSIFESDLLLNQDIFLVSSNYRYELMRRCRTAIAKSGTVTLELALHNVPTVVTYRLTSFNRFVAKYLLRLKLPFYCIVNILAQKQVFPELIEKKMTTENLLHELTLLHNDPVTRKSIKDECELIQKSLGSSQPHQKAAMTVLELMNAQNT